MAEVFWAIHHREHGFYCGTYMKRYDAIEQFLEDIRCVPRTYGRDSTWGECLNPEQSYQWAKMKRMGNSCRKVKLVPA